MPCPRIRKFFKPFPAREIFFPFTVYEIFGMNPSRLMVQIFISKISDARNIFFIFQQFYTTPCSQIEMNVKTLI